MSEGTTLSKLLKKQMAGPRETATRKAVHRGVRSAIHLESKSKSSEAKTYAKNSLKSQANLGKPMIEGARAADKKRKR